MTSAARRFRLGALLGAGALAVHELRYLLAYGDHAGREASAQGHAYLSVLVPIVLLAVVFAAAQAIRRFAGAADAAGGGRFVRLWLGCAATLAAVYFTQELTEGWLAAGHAVGVAGVLGHGGWIGLASAPIVGGLIALALRGAADAAAPCATASEWRPAPAPAPALASPTLDFHPSPDPLARFLAGRGPPLTSL